MVNEWLKRENRVSEKRNGLHLGQPPQTIVT